MSQSVHYRPQRSIVLREADLTLLCCHPQSTVSIHLQILHGRVSDPHYGAAQTPRVHSRSLRGPHLRQRNHQRHACDVLSYEPIANPPNSRRPPHHLLPSLLPLHPPLFHRSPRPHPPHHHRRRARHANRHAHHRPDPPALIDNLSEQQRARADRGAVLREEEAERRARLVWRRKGRGRGVLGGVDARDHACDA